VVPTIPPELILAPKWFPVHLTKMSYWARTVVVPLLVLCALRPVARIRAVCWCPNYSGKPAGLTSQAAHVNPLWKGGFEVLDWALKRFENHWPKGMRKRAIDLCAGWVTERLNGEDGLGAIYPAMANSVMMYDALGYAPDHPHRAIARTSVDKLLVVKDDEAYCQPCVSRCGYGSGRPCHAGGGHAQGRRTGPCRARLAGSAADHGHGGRLGGTAPRCAPGRLGVPVWQ
jgi:squalene-hopene/tetraprenyl-beta-curcumene cyclase